MGQQSSLFSRHLDIKTPTKNLFSYLNGFDNTLCGNVLLNKNQNLFTYQVVFNKQTWKN